MMTMWKENETKIIYLGVAVLFEIILLCASTMYVPLFSFSFFIVTMAAGFSIYRIISQIWLYDVNVESCDKNEPFNIRARMKKWARI